MRYYINYESILIFFSLVRPGIKGGSFIYEPSTLSILFFLKIFSPSSLRFWSNNFCLASKFIPCSSITSPGRAKGSTFPFCFDFYRVASLLILFYIFCSNFFCYLLHLAFFFYFGIFVLFFVTIFHLIFFVIV